MLTEVTSGVRISVLFNYEPGISSPLLDSYVFSYHITIENQNDYAVQLLRRHWFIFDSIGINREVEGAGVVGQQPVIQPGEYYTYSSACDLKSLRGKMHGFFTMQKIQSKELVRVVIPQFKLEVPYGKN
jgi:ApaG protein